MDVTVATTAIASPTVLPAVGEGTVTFTSGEVLAALA